jgi:hypothetical protein
MDNRNPYSAPNKTGIASSRAPRLLYGIPLFLFVVSLSIVESAVVFLITDRDPEIFGLLMMSGGVFGVLNWYLIVRVCNGLGRLVAGIGLVGLGLSLIMISNPNYQSMAKLFALVVFCQVPVFWVTSHLRVESKKAYSSTINSG